MADVEDDCRLSVTGQDTRTEEAETTISSQPAVVFQCSLCNSVVGDSLSWMSSSKIMRTVTLAFVTSKVGVRQVVEISKTGIDKDSTYKTVYCVNCNEVLGRQYLASAPDLDCIRGNFTFLVEKLNSYEIGSAESGGVHDLADFLAVPDTKYMQQQISKINLLILSMNARIKALESVHTEENPDVSDGGASNTNSQDVQYLQSNEEETESVSSSENVGNMLSVKNQQHFNMVNRNLQRERRTVLLEPPRGSMTMFYRQRPENDNDNGESLGIQVNKSKRHTDKIPHSHQKMQDENYNNAKRVEDKKGQMSENLRGNRMNLYKGQVSSPRGEPPVNSPREKMTANRVGRRPNYIHAGRSSNIDNLSDISVSAVASSGMDEGDDGESCNNGSLMEQWPSPNPGRNKKRRKVMD